MTSQIALLFSELKNLLNEDKTEEANESLVALDKAIRELFTHRNVSELNEEEVILLTQVNTFFHEAKLTLADEAKTVQESLLKIKKADKVRKAYRL